MIEFKSFNDQNFLTSYWLTGKQSYKDWLCLQENYSKKSIQHLKSFVFGLEHESTITLGLSAHKNLKDEIFLSSEKLKLQGIKILKVFRGGKTTIHSPGQLIIYPIFHLRQFGLKLKVYIDLLFQATIRFLKIYGILGLRNYKNPGIYTQRGKIAFLGLRVHRGVSSYGLAINVFNDLSLFSLIKTCGEKGQNFDSMGNFGISIHLKELFFSWVNEFLSVLKENKLKDSLGFKKSCLEREIHLGRKNSGEL